MGMFIVLVVIVMSSKIDVYSIFVVGIGGGVVIGIGFVRSVAMRSMFEFVVLLYSFVGAAVVLVGFVSYLGFGMYGFLVIFNMEIFIDVLIGAIIFIGSVVVYFKLKGTLFGCLLFFFVCYYLNLVAVIVCIGLGVLFVKVLGYEGLSYLILMFIVVSVLGIHFVVVIGGADMLVVVFMFNSYFGWMVVVVGFMLSNDLLIIIGVFVGFLGVILSYIMCCVMNRSIWSVIFGGFGMEGVVFFKIGDQVAQGEVMETDVEIIVVELFSACEVIIVLGYGMVVGWVQYVVYELIKLFRDRNIRVRFGIYFVVGCFFGYMNVFLVEVNVLYDIVLEMEEFNEDFFRMDVTFVVGVNDIVNFGVQIDQSSPIYGMFVFEVWKSVWMVVFKWSWCTGYVGVDNLFFYDFKIWMLFGDVKDSVFVMVVAI